MEGHMGTAFFEDEEMKLRKEDQEFFQAEIRQEVKTAVQDYLHPQGWKKFAHWLREWSLVALVPTLIVALLGLVLTSAYYAFSRVSREADFQAHTTDKLGDIQGSLSKLTATVDEIRLKQLADNPANPQSAGEATELLAEARK